MKNALLIILSSVFLLFACKDKEPIPNRPPGEFTVKSTLGTDGKTVTLNWTKAKDPDGDAVTYTVVLGSDTLTKGLTDTVYVLKNLNYDFSGSGSVLALDSKKLSSSSKFSLITNASNKPPGEFTVKPTLASDGKTVTLNWTKAIDPDGDAVTYRVVLGKDTLAKRLIETTFILKDLGFNFSGTGSIIAYESKNLGRVTGFIAETKINPTFTILDKLFEEYLVEMEIDKDGLINGRMAIQDTKGVNVINLSRRQIQTLSGIENFNELESLSCKRCLLTSLDVSKNVKLRYLDCSDNKLKNLDVTKNVNLTYLDCSSNLLSNLDVTNNLSLENLKCYFTPLTSLDISKNVKLIKLDCSTNKITNLDLKNNVLLKDLFCSSNKLIALEVSKNINLETIDCARNQIESLDVSKNTELKYLKCGNNKLTRIDLSKSRFLTVLECYENLLTELELSKNSQLLDLRCFNNQISNLDLTSSKYLYYLDCRDNNMTSLNVSKNIYLETLDCKFNPKAIICVSDVVKAQANPQWLKHPAAEYKICN